MTVMWLFVSQLSCDADSNVRYGAELLDKLMKVCILLVYY